jgi:aquaporin Z
LGCSAGAIAGALVLDLILSGTASGWNGALGQTTWGEYSTLSAFVFELIGTFLFSLAGVAIGLILAAIDLVGINISCSSVNPARSLGPAIVARNLEILKQNWLYILAPLLGTAG